MGYWKVFKVTNRYTKLPMYACMYVCMYVCIYVCMYVLNIGLLQWNLSRLFSRACFNFFDYFSRHLTNVSTFVLCRKNVEKISRSTWKKNARLNFISARQYSKQTYINSYFPMLFSHGNNKKYEYYIVSRHVVSFDLQKCVLYIPLIFLQSPSSYDGPPAIIAAGKQLYFVSFKAKKRIFFSLLMTTLFSHFFSTSSATLHSNERFEELLTHSILQSHFWPPN